MTLYRKSVTLLQGYGFATYITLYNYGGAFLSTPPKDLIYLYIA